MTARLRLKRSDGQTYMRRWGFETKRFGVFVHRFEAPDPGEHAHDHPFAFASLVLKGSYVERRHEIEREDFFFGTPADKGTLIERKRFSWKTLRFYEAHRIVSVEPGTCTWVLHGRRRLGWGFFTPEGYVPHEDYVCRDLSEERP